MTLFRKWFEQESPDVILTTSHIVKKWLADLDYRVPADIGLIQLEWDSENADWAGMDQHNDTVGAAAVDLLTEMIHHHTESVSIFSQSRLIGSTWIDGTTVNPLEELTPLIAC